MTDDDYMRLAIEEANLAAGRGEVPVGAIIVRDGRVLSRGHNLRQTSHDPTSHAEVVAIRGAAARLNTWHLSDAQCFVTLEPCAMCAGALVLARVARVVWGCDDPKAGATRSLYSIGSDERLNHRFEIKGGVLGDECATQLSGFFASLRGKRKKSRR